jgi:hypothetical protein
MIKLTNRTASISLEMVKLYLKITNSFEDDLITKFIFTAEDAYELYFKEIVGIKEFVYFEENKLQTKITFNKYPLIEVISCKENGNDIAFNVKNNQKSFTVELNTPAAVEIKFLAGGMANSNLLIQDALMKHITLLYNNRETVLSKEDILKLYSFKHYVKI